MRRSYIRLRLLLYVGWCWRILRLWVSGEIGNRISMREEINATRVKLQLS